MSNKSWLVAAVMLALLVAFSGCVKEISSDANMTTTAYQVKNPELKDEVARLHSEMTLRNLTENDTASVLQFSTDPVERFYADEFTWLVRHNKSEHYNHPLTFLDWYVRTGQENFCAPHEIGHIAAYIEGGDIAYAETQLIVAREKLPMWAQKQDRNRERFPQYYDGLDELKALIGEAMPLLEQEDYSSETLALLKEIDEKSVC